MKKVIGLVALMLLAGCEPPYSEPRVVVNYRDFITMEVKGNEVLTSIEDQRSETFAKRVRIAEKLCQSDGGKQANFIDNSHSGINPGPFQVGYFYIDRTRFHCVNTN